MFYAYQSNLVMIAQNFLKIKQYSNPGVHKLSKNLKGISKF